MEKITIENVELILSHPVNVTTQWVGQAEPLRQLSACWLARLVLKRDDQNAQEISYS